MINKIYGPRSEIKVEVLLSLLAKLSAIFSTEAEKGQSENIFWIEKKFQIQIILSHPAS